jgi:replication protein
VNAATTTQEAGEPACARGGAVARAREAPQAPSLGHTRNERPTQVEQSKRQASRQGKWDARERLREVTTMRRLKACGLVSMIDGGEVEVRRAGDGTTSYAGLVTCGSVWSCPVCSAKVARERAEGLTQLIEWNTARGGSVALLTLTMRHHRGQRLRELRRALTKAWDHVTASRGWKHARKQAGMDGYVRAIEVTHGASGFHVHIHCLLVFDHDVSEWEIEALQDEVFTRWSAGLAKSGMSVLREIDGQALGVDLRKGETALDTFANYINKIAFEAVGGVWKRGHVGGRTPFQVLGDFLATGSADDLAIWREWEQGSKGMRQLVWTKGLKGRVGIGERTDEEIAAQSQDAEPVITLPARTWKEIRENPTALLDAAEESTAAACAWLEARGLAFEVVEHVVPKGLDVLEFLGRVGPGAFRRLVELGL